MRQCFFEVIDLAQAQQKISFVERLTIIQQLIMSLVAAFGAVRKHVFQLQQPGQVTTEREVAPTKCFS